MGGNSIPPIIHEGSKAKHCHAHHKHFAKYKTTGCVGLFCDGFMNRVSQKMRD